MSIRDWILIVVAILGGFYLIWKFFFQKKDNQNKSDDGVDTPSNEETKDSSNEHLETPSDKEIKKDEGTLSVPASGATKQTEKGIHLERSSPESADNQSLETESMSDDGSPVSSPNNLREEDNP